MKMNITLKDLNSLSSAQKIRLRELWIPKKNQMAVASVCVDVETDEYENLEFVIGEVLLMEDNGDKKKMNESDNITIYSNHTMFLQRYNLLEKVSTNASSNSDDEDEEDEDEYDEEFNDDYDDEEVEELDYDEEEDDDEDEDEYDDDYEVDEDDLLEEEFFSRDICVPMLNIGELIEMLIKVKHGNNGFSIGVPALNSGLDELFRVQDNFGDDIQGSELCDILWEALKLKL